MDGASTREVIRFFCFGYCLLELDGLVCPFS
jgi:hypothetical protein